MKAETLKTFNKYRAIISICVGLFFCSSFLGAQGLLTAGEYFDKVSTIYGKISDYEALITITEEDGDMNGTLYYKTPHLIRIDFENPKSQVLTITGDTLLIYIPKYQVTLKQTLPKRSTSSLASMASSQGLNFLRDYYRVSYLTGPEPIPLDPESEEKVVKLKFIWRDSAEGFKEIIISFQLDGTIRRIKGKKALTNKYIQFDFEKIKLNQNLPDERFQYDPPPYANEFDNFLFEENN